MPEPPKAEDRLNVILSFVYRVVGRIALITAFLLAIDGKLRAAVASLAVALWMMWSAQNLFIRMMGRYTDLLVEKLPEASQEVTDSASGERETSYTSSREE